MTPGATLSVAEGEKSCVVRKIERNQFEIMKNILLSVVAATICFSSLSETGWTIASAEKGKLKLSERVKPITFLAWRPQ